MVGGQRKRRAAVVVGGRGCGHAHGGRQRVHIVRQERSGHGGLGVEVREPAGHHLTVAVVMVAAAAATVVVMVVMVATAAVMVAVLQASHGGVPIGRREARRRSGGPGRGRRRRLRVLWRDGRHRGRRADPTAAAVRQAQQLLYGERRPLRHRLVFGGRAHRRPQRITCAATRCTTVRRYKSVSRR